MLRTQIVGHNEKTEAEVLKLVSEQLQHLVSQVNKPVFSPVQDFV